MKMAKITRLKFNDSAPDLDVQTADGDTIRLASLWADKTVLIAFARHFGCLNCQEMLSQLMTARTEIAQAGLKLVVVTQGTASETREFCSEHAPHALCLADPKRQSYRAFGLTPGNAWQVFIAPQVWVDAWRSRRHGHRPSNPPGGQSLTQLSGIFIVGTDGKVRLPYYYDTLGDHPPIEILLRGVLGTSWTKPLDGPLA
jgi:peroxiredoxin